MAKQLSDMETLFKALADATRLRILGLLLTGEVCVCDIHESLKIPQSKASRHLAYLRRSGLVETRRDGLWIHYRLATRRPGARRHRRSRAACAAHIEAVQRDASACRSGPAAACRCRRRRRHVVLRGNVIDLGASALLPFLSSL